MNISEMTRDRAIVTIKRQLEVIYTLSHGDTLTESTATNQHSVFAGKMPFLSPNQQRRSTEGKFIAASTLQCKLYFLLNVNGVKHFYLLLGILLQMSVKLTAWKL